MWSGACPKGIKIAGVGFHSAMYNVLTAMRSSALILQRAKRDQLPALRDCLDGLFRRR